MIEYAAVLSLVINKKAALEGERVRRREVEAKNNRRGDHYILSFRTKRANKVCGYSVTLLHVPHATFHLPPSNRASAIQDGEAAAWRGCASPLRAPWKTLPWHSHKTLVKVAVTNSSYRSAL